MASPSPSIYYNPTTIKESTSTSGAWEGVVIPEASKNDLNTFDGSMDIPIAGDNDGDGYFADYLNNEIVIKKVSSNFTWNLAGNGTLTSPYLIKSIADYNLALTKISNGYYFRLEKDLDFKNKPFYMFGTYYHKFKGYLDGNGHKISNIVLNSNNYVGFCGYSSEGAIYNLTLENINITGNNYVGGLIGYDSWGPQIKDNNLNGLIIATGDYVGGLIGRLDGSIISGNRVNAKVIGNNNVGGMAGYLFSNNGSKANFAYPGTLLGGSIEGNNNVNSGIGGLDPYTIPNPVPIIYCSSSISLNIKGKTGYNSWSINN